MSVRKVYTRLTRKYETKRNVKKKKNLISCLHGDSIVTTINYPIGRWRRRRWPRGCVSWPYNNYDAINIPGSRCSVTSRPPPPGEAYFSRLYSAIFPIALIARRKKHTEFSILHLCLSTGISELFTPGTLFFFFFFSNAGNHIFLFFYPLSRNIFEKLKF